MMYYELRNVIWSRRYEQKSKTKANHTKVTVDYINVQHKYIYKPIEY